MTRRCDSNPAQYERNRRFGHLVHALGRAAGGAKLPSVGLCLNASKAVSFLVKGGNDISRSLGDRVWNAKSTAVAAVSGSSPRTLKIQERATWNSRAGSYPYPQQVSKVNSL
uniref:Uncharacterized protein n=1 Tax=Trichogramma kaykai TaxID=54128 RepID=A0ABD2WKV2_9HYME